MEDSESKTENSESKTEKRDSDIEMKKVMFEKMFEGAGCGSSDIGDFVFLFSVIHVSDNKKLDQCECPAAKSRRSLRASSVLCGNALRDLLHLFPANYFHLHYMEAKTYSVCDDKES